jgi:hypothetical protein
VAIHGETQAWVSPTSGSANLQVCLDLQQVMNKCDDERKANSKRVRESAGAFRSTAGDE